MIAFAGTSVYLIIFVCRSEWRCSDGERSRRSCEPDCGIARPSATAANASRTVGGGINRRRCGCVCCCVCRIVVFTLLVTMLSVILVGDLLLLTAVLLFTDEARSKSPNSVRRAVSTGAAAAVAEKKRDTSPWAGQVIVSPSQQTDMHTYIQRSEREKKRRDQAMSAMSETSSQQDTASALGSILSSPLQPRSPAAAAADISNQSVASTQQDNVFMTDGGALRSIESHDSMLSSRRSAGSLTAGGSTSARRHKSPFLLDDADAPLGVGVPLRHTVTFAQSAFSPPTAAAATTTATTTAAAAAATGEGSSFQPAAIIAAATALAAKSPRASSVVTPSLVAAETKPRAPPLRTQAPAELKRAMKPYAVKFDLSILIDPFFVCVVCAGL